MPRLRTAKNCTTNKTLNFTSFLVDQMVNLEQTHRSNCILRFYGVKTVWNHSIDLVD